MLSEESSNPSKDCKKVQGKVSDGRGVKDKSEPKGKWRRFASSEYYAYVIIFAIFFYPLILPVFYVKNSNFPQKGEVKHSIGRFVYRDGGKSGFYAGIERNGRKEFFSCVSEYGVANYCEFEREEYNRFDGKYRDAQEEMFKFFEGEPAEISWFNQSLNLLSNQKRIVEMLVNGRVVISKENVRKNMVKTRDGWFSGFIMVLSFLLGVLLLIKKFSINKRRKTLK